jgi:hypothetical protein
MDGSSKVQAQDGPRRSDQSINQSRGFGIWTLQLGSEFPSDHHGCQPHSLVLSLDFRKAETGILILILLLNSKVSFTDSKRNLRRDQLHGFLTLLQLIERQAFKEQAFTRNFPFCIHSLDWQRLCSKSSSFVTFWTSISKWQLSECWRVHA